MPGRAQPIMEGADALNALRERGAKANREGQHTIVAMYSSVLGGVTRDPAFFAVPIDDHMATRGHAVFDTCNVGDGMAYGLDFHLDRLLRSAKQARMKLKRADWLGNTAEPKQQKERLRAIILDTIAATGRRDGVYCRYWLSAARGDFAVSPNKCVEGPNFYVAVHSTAVAPTKPKAGASKAQTVVESTVSMPLKSKYLATLKSNNYMINALCAMEAQEKTGDPGSLGLQVDDRGYLAEFSIASVAVIGSDGVLRSPHPKRILRSTTVVRCMQLAREQLLPRGQLRGVEYADITLNDAYEATEVLQLGGGHVTAVVKLNGHVIAGGKPGPIATALAELVDRESVDSAFAERIPYERYEGRDVGVTRPPSRL